MEIVNGTRIKKRWCAPTLFDILIPTWNYKWGGGDVRLGNLYQSYFKEIKGKSNTRNHQVDLHNCLKRGKILKYFIVVSVVAEILL